MSLSYKAKLEFTIFGYIRLNYKVDIIDDIKRICLEYFNSIEMTWNVFCNQWSEFVSDDGLEINIPKESYIDMDEYRNFSTSTGWNEGIHHLALQIKPACKNLSIGIISQDDIPNVASTEFGTKYFLYSKNKAAIGYCLDNLQRVYAIKNGSFKDVTDWKSYRVKDEDENLIITMVVDCDKWTLTFYVNKKILFESINIIKDQVYHPIFTEWSSDEKCYKLIESTVDQQ